MSTPNLAPLVDEQDEYPTKGADPQCPACAGSGCAHEDVVSGCFRLCLCMRPATPWPKGRELKALAELLTYRWGRMIFINGGFAGTCGQWGYLTREASAPKPRSHLR